MLDWIEPQLDAFEVANGLDEQARGADQEQRKRDLAGHQNAASGNASSTADLAAPGILQRRRRLQIGAA